MKQDKKKAENTVRRYEELVKDHIVLEKVCHIHAFKL